MIDIHSHLLPGLDDGSKDLTTSLNLARDAVADGITHSLMTPHHMNGRYTNHAADVIAATNTFQMALNEHQIPLTVFPAQEVRINGDLIAALEAGDILTADAGGKYLLLEFPSNEVPAYTERIFFDIQQHGLIPIIVHPERNEGMMTDPNILYELESRGALAQVTASSYVGTFGKAVQQFAEDIVGHGLAQVFASDAHHIPGRDYEMQLAFEKLRKNYGEGKAEIFNENAKAIVNGDAVQLFKEEPIKKRKFFSKY